MPKKAGHKLSTPRTRDFARWLMEDIGRARRTADGYEDAVEFLAAIVAGTDKAVRLPSAVNTPHEQRFATNREPAWSKVTLDDVEAFVRRPLEDGTTPSMPTRRRRIYACKAFFEYLCDHGVVKTDVTRRLRSPGVSMGKPKPVPDDVWLQVWDRPLGPDDRVLLGLGYYLGFRRHEMIGLAPHNVSLSRRRVADFPRKGGKTNEVVYGANLDIISKHLPRLGVRLDEFEDALTLLVNSRRGEARLLALTEHIEAGADDSTINRRMTALSRHADQRVTPHQLRHSFGTNLIRCGVPEMVVADQMAHANMETTHGYVDTTLWYETTPLLVGSL